LEEANPRKAFAKEEGRPGEFSRPFPAKKPMPMPQMVNLKERMN